MRARARFHFGYKKLHSAHKKSHTWGGRSWTTFADVREAVATLEDVERIARRVFGGSHPDVVWMDQNLRLMRKSLSARETAVAGAK